MIKISGIRILNIIIYSISIINERDLPVMPFSALYEKNKSLLQLVQRLLLEIFLGGIPISIIWKTFNSSIEKFHLLPFFITKSFHTEKLLLRLSTTSSPTS